MAIKIVQFYKHFLAEGGMPRETLLLARAMCKYVDVEVFCLSPDEYGRETTSIVRGVRTRIFGVSKKLYNSKWSIWLPHALAVALENSSPDIVLLTGAFISEHFSLSRLLQRLGIPYVLSVGEAFNPNTFHGLKGIKKRVWYELFERTVVQGALALRIYSDVQKEHLARCDIDARYILVKEGVDWENIPREFVSAPTDGVGLDRPIFAFLGRLDIYKKGLDILLDGFRFYKSHGGRGKLKIAGPSVKGSLTTLQKTIARLRIADVEFMGEISGFEKFTFLKSVSCLCVPSRHEGIPRVIREALAVGCPVFVTENTNMHDLVKKYNCGFVTGADPRDIATALGEYERMALRARMELSMTALKTAQELDWDRIACDYVEQIKKFHLTCNTERCSSRPNLILGTRPHDKNRETGGLKSAVLKIKEVLR
jgi:glycosyltransferase involved in cell wall biosynthesis